MKRVMQYGLNGVATYDYPELSEVPEDMQICLIEKVWKVENTAAFKIDGVSDTPRMWTISYTLRGQETTKSETIEKTIGCYSPVAWMGKRVGKHFGVNKMSDNRLGAV